MQYDIPGEELWHQRLALSHVTGGEWVILSPDGDLYSEDLRGIWKPRHFSMKIGRALWKLPFRSGSKPNPFFQPSPDPGAVPRPATGRRCLCRARTSSAWSTSSCSCRCSSSRSGCWYGGCCAAKPGGWGREQSLQSLEGLQPMPTLAQELPGLVLGLGAWTWFRRTPEPWASPETLLGTASTSSDWHPWSAKRSASTTGQLPGHERCCMSSQRLWSMGDLLLPIRKLGGLRASSSHPTIAQDHEMLCRILHTMVVYDQLDVANIAAAELGAWDSTHRGAAQDEVGGSRGCGRSLFVSRELRGKPCWDCHIPKAFRVDWSRNAKGGFHSQRTLQSAGGALSPEKPTRPRKRKGHGCHRLGMEHGDLRPGPPCWVHGGLLGSWPFCFFFKVSMRGLRNLNVRLPWPEISEEGCGGQGSDFWKPFANQGIKALNELTGCSSCQVSKSKKTTRAQRRVLNLVRDASQSAYPDDSCFAGMWWAS